MNNKFQGSQYYYWEGIPAPKRDPEFDEIYEYFTYQFSPDTTFVGPEYKKLQKDIFGFIKSIQYMFDSATKIASKMKAVYHPILNTKTIGNNVQRHTDEAGGYGGALTDIFVTHVYAKNQFTYEIPLLGIDEDNDDNLDIMLNKFKDVLSKALTKCKKYIDCEFEIVRNCVFGINGSTTEGTVLYINISPSREILGMVDDLNLPTKEQILNKEGVETMNNTNAIEHTNDFDNIFSDALESIIDLELSYANEARGGADDHKLTAEQRKALPDKAFGIPGSRKYPLNIPGDRGQSLRCTRKAIEYFHFVKPEWRDELAKNILATIKKLKFTSSEIYIASNNRILKHATFPKEYIKEGKKVPKGKEGFNK